MSAAPEAVQAAPHADVDADPIAAGAAAAAPAQPESAPLASCSSSMCCAGGWL